MLIVDNISKVFGNKSDSTEFLALDSISFRIKAGEFVSIVGPSGSGKSTLLNIIGALDKPTSGRLVINNNDTLKMQDSELSDLRNRFIGFIFQSYNLINRMTVKQNIEFPALFSEKKKFEIEKLSIELMEILCIKDKVYQKPINLSGGEQQRVAIARALINNPVIILADEPTGNLDTKAGKEVFGLLRMLCDKYTTTIIMVTHNLELAAMTGKSIHIKDGRLEQEVVNYRGNQKKSI